LVGSEKGSEYGIYAKSDIGCGLGWGYWAK